MIRTLSMMDAAKVLRPVELEILSSHIQQASSPTLAKRDDVDPVVVRSMMIRLGVLPVWGRAGQEVYRLWVGSKLVIFSLEHDPAAGAPPPEALTTEFREHTSVDAMMGDMLLHVRAEKALAGRSITIVSEDHPEIMSIGFRAFETDTVWLIPTSDIERDVEAKAITYVDVHQLIQSARGRDTLAERISALDMLSDKDLTDVWSEASAHRPAELSASEKKDLMVNMLSAQLADRYCKRFLKKKDA